MSLVGAYGQDTLSLTLKGVDSVFLSNNMLLLAQRYRVDASKALITQARLWNNPAFTAELNAYNPARNAYFDIGKQGQKIFQVEQLITMAGKRSRAVALAEAGKRYDEAAFEEIMRTLRLELRVQFYTIWFNSITLQKYAVQLDLLQTIIDALQEQNAHGNIPLKEVLRLKAVYYKLNNERTDLATEIGTAVNKLRTLLNQQAYISPVVDDSLFWNYDLAKIDPATLIDVAVKNRPDLKMAEQTQQQSLLNYKLQKSLAYPDLRLGGVYDQAGSYTPNYTGLTVGFDLPLWNRNQGNIKYARAVSAESKLHMQNKMADVRNGVLAAYQNLQLVEQEYRKVDADFGGTFESLNAGFVSNFQKRNISLFEFVDFFEAYNESVLQLNQLKEKRIRAYEELNYAIGKSMFGY